MVLGFDGRDVAALVIRQPYSAPAKLRALTYPAHPAPSLERGSNVRGNGVGDRVARNGRYQRPLTDLLRVSRILETGRPVSGPVAIGDSVRFGQMKVAVFGATGVIGRALLPVLVARGFDVTGTTRRSDRIPSIEGLGARGLVCDGTSADSIDQVMRTVSPEVVVHLMTDLPQNWASLRNGSPTTDKLRRDGTANLVRAAREHGARKMVAQSLAFMYQPGNGLAVERDAVWLDGPSLLTKTYGAVLELERQVVSATNLEGVVLRYGTLYGPGTWYDVDGDIAHRVRRRQLPVIGSGEGCISFLHVNDAATATAAAIERPTPQGNTLNVNDDSPVSHCEFLPAWADLEGWPRPLTIPAWLAAPLAGSAGVAVMTKQRGASNAAAKAHLNWHPQYRTWREGFNMPPRRDGHE